MVSLWSSKHRKKNSYKYKKNGKNSLTTTTIMVVPLQGANYCFQKNDWIYWAWMHENGRTWACHKEYVRAWMCDKKNKGALTCCK